MSGGIVLLHASIPKRKRPSRFSRRPLFVPAKTAVCPELAGRTPTHLARAVPSALRALSAVRSDPGCFARFALALHPAQAHALQRINRQTHQECECTSHCHADSNFERQEFQCLHKLPRTHDHHSTNQNYSSRAQEAIELCPITQCHLRAIYVNGHPS